MNVEEKQQSALQRNIQRELEWIRQNAKGQQKKGKVHFFSFFQVYHFLSLRNL